MQMQFRHERRRHYFGGAGDEIGQRLVLPEDHRAKRKPDARSGFRADILFRIRDEFGIRELREGPYPVFDRVEIANDHQHHVIQRQIVGGGR